MFKEPGTPTPKSKKDMAGYNPFADSITAAAARAEQHAATQAPILDVEEKTKPFPAMETARSLPVTKDEEIIEGELLEEGTPTMEGFQSSAEVAQEQLQKAQERINIPAKRISQINPDKPNSLQEGTRDVLSTLLADDVARQEFEEYLALLIPGTDMEKIQAMETHMQPKVQWAARAHGDPKSVEELRAELHKFFVAKKKYQP